MKLNIKSTYVDMTPSFRIYIEKKMEPLDKFIKRFEEESEAEMFLEVSRITRHHRHGDVFRAAVSVRLPKHVLRAEEKAGDARLAVDMARDTLRLELEKYRERFLGSRRPKQDK